VNAFGLSKSFITDRGTCYTFKMFERFCSEQGIQLVLTSSRHPRANGQVERTHSVVMAALMTRNDAVNGWDESFTVVERYMNNSESKVTQRPPLSYCMAIGPGSNLGPLRTVYYLG